VPPQLPELAVQLHAGIVHDMARMGAGAPLRPLGEGAVCDWCEARGLCRKDFWT
jgi:ATP-dependent helicase/nuclease subunit B